MSDKSKNGPHERTVWVSPRTRAGDDHHYGDWRDSDGEHKWYDGPEDRGNPLGVYYARGIPLTIIEYATGGDYAGNLVERSNARTLKAEFPWLVELHGGYGTFGVAYLGRRQFQSAALIEAIDSLEAYPVYNADDHSALEMERTEATWEEDGRKDWMRALVTMWDRDDEDTEHDEDKLDASLVDALWYDCVECLQGGESARNESGDSIYFPIDGIVKKLSDNRYAAVLDRPTWGSDNRSIREKLNELRDACRVEESEA